MPVADALSAIPAEDGPTTNIPLEYVGLQAIPPYGIELWTILAPLGQYPKYTTLSRQTLEQLQISLPAFQLYHCSNCKFMTDKYGKANAHKQDKKHIVYELIDDTILVLG